MTKHYTDGEELQKKILSGVNKLANNVASTLGPKGKNTILFKPGSGPIITKDGVTVADFVDLEDPFENAAAQILKQAASETNNSAGDGTTTSTVLAREIYSRSQRYLNSGCSPVELKRGMQKALQEVVRGIKEMARPIESKDDIEHIATISANGDSSIGKLISTAVEQAGHDGAITVEEAKSFDTSLNLVEGFRFNSGYFAQAFVTNERKNSVDYSDSLILVTDHKVDTVQGILPILEMVAREGKPLIVVAEQVEGQALAALIMNTVRGSMKVAAIHAPSYGQERKNIMSDLCLSTGAEFISRASGRKLSEVKLSDLGICDRVEILKNHTTIVGGQADWNLVETKIDSLKSEIKQTDDMEECRTIQKRITRLSSGVAIIKVGGATEVEMVEKKHRIEDALEAVRAAMSEGVVPGGGVARLRCTQFKIQAENADQRLGASIIRESLSAPIKQMALNAALSPDLIVQNVKRSKNKGWDFKNNKLTCMLSSGIIDPSKVTRTALQNAVSVASTLITTTNAIVED